MLENNPSSTGIVKITDKEFSTMVQFVHRKYGIDLSKKRQLIEGRLAQTLREKNCSSFEQYLDLLFKDKTGTEITGLLNKITTNHSYFARENEHFEFLVNRCCRIWKKPSEPRSAHLERGLFCRTGAI